VVAKSLPQLPITDAALQKAMQQAKWPARLQKLTQGPLVEAWGDRGPVMLDGGHNPHAAKALSAWINTQSTPITLLCGIMRRKDAAGFLAPLAKNIAHFIAVPIKGNDASPPRGTAGSSAITRSHKPFVRDIP